MTRSLSRVFVRVIAEARATVASLASEAGYRPVTIYAYTSNQRLVSRQAALAMAGALERRAVRLNVLAAQIREAADDHPDDASASMGRGHACDSR